MFIPAMLLEKSDKPFNDPAFLFEPKIDGHTLIMSFKNGETMKGHDDGLRISRSANTNGQKRPTRTVKCTL
jgi:hypothetical protein